MSKPEYRIWNKQLLSGKKILVMGLGRFGGGVDSARFAAKAGGKVVITDLASAEKLNDSVGQLAELGDIEYHLGGHRREDFEEADIVIVNPAVAADNEFVGIARQGNKLLTSQINIFFEMCPARIIGITGANGKSTTAALTAHLLKGGGGQKQRNYGKVWLSGNIGNEPLLAELGGIGADDLVVLELSSFQLEQSAWVGKAPKVALLTNLTPNHLDRHGTFADYCSAKENIFKLQRADENGAAISIFNGEDEIGAEWFEKYKGQAGRVCMKFCTDEVSEEIRGQFGLAGRANLSNLAAAITIARHFGVEEAVMKDCLSGFKPLPHRLELVALSGGVCWYNDSIATTPVSAIAALEAFGQPKIIIAGGYDKGLCFEELGEKMAQRAKAVILIGQTGGEIADAIRKHPQGDAKIEFAGTLAEAVKLAVELAASGDVVLLSPGCASYDMFDNFEHRGREFVRLVKQICG